MSIRHFAAVLVAICSLAVIPSYPVLAGQQSADATDKKTILFVCEHGSAKSIIAAAHFNDMAARNGLPYRAIARGAHPDKEIPPYITSGLAAEGLNILGWQPKLLAEDDALRSDR